MKMVRCFLVCLVTTIITEYTIYSFYFQRKFNNNPCHNRRGYDDLWGRLVAALSKARHRRRFIFWADSDSDSEGSSSNWMESLRARQLELDKHNRELSKKWRSANCSTEVALVLPDWIRRVDVEYPLAACGSASGKVYLAHLERQEIIASTVIGEKEVEEDEYPDSLAQTLRSLYGAHDGGGTIAIAFAGNLICEAGRLGGVQVWRLDPVASRLMPQGSMISLKNTLVTCLELEEDYLWVGTAQGAVKAYPLEENLPLVLQSKPELAWKLDSAVLSLSVSSELGCVVVTTSSGAVQLLSIEGGDEPTGSFYPPFDSSVRKSSNAHALSATIISHASKADNDLAFSVACGGNDGSLYLQPIHMTGENEIDTKLPFNRPLISMRPRHFGPVKCLASPCPGLLISGGHDGALRVWDVDERACLYQWVGYKVWLGSIWTDGTRVISDGADNTVIMHDFQSSTKQT